MLMAKNNLCWLESEAMDLSSEASKGQIFLLGRLPLECSSLSALSTCTVESPQVSSRVFMPCFPWNGKTDLSLLKYYISSPQIKINLRKQFTRTKCSLEAGGKNSAVFHAVRVEEARNERNHVGRKQKLSEGGEANLERVSSLWCCVWKPEN